MWSGMSGQCHSRLNGRRMTMGITIITDSGSDIKQEIAKKWGIRVLPLTVRFGDEEFLDDVTLKQASEELGVPIVATAQDGFASWDAITGEQNDQNVISDKIGRTGEETEYYRYNQNE